MSMPERVESSEEDTELTEIVVQLKRVWRDVLGKDTEKIGLNLTPSTNFFLVRGNSLLVIRLLARIRQAFNVAVPLVQLLSADTLGEITRKIEESVSIDLIDWEQENFSPAIPSFLCDLATEGERKAKTVMTTSGTDALAKYLLSKLAARSYVSTIHCIAVRDKPRSGDPPSSPKIQSSASAFCDCRCSDFT